MCAHAAVCASVLRMYSHTGILESRTEKVGGRQEDGGVSYLRLRCSQEAWLSTLSGQLESQPHPEEFKG